MNQRTEQEAFWEGEFGTEYSRRNRGEALHASNLHFFSVALRSARGLRSCVEFGANIGMNLRALRALYPSQEQHAVEINANAARELAEASPDVGIFNGAIEEFPADRTWDLVLIKGVLIHVRPESLPGVYDMLHRCTRRYLLVAEYYNPTPVAIPYRGHEDRLFKRDFCGELLDRFSDLSLLDYGFAYRRDPNFPQDDITWFLIERSGHAGDA